MRTNTQLKGIYAVTDAILSPSTDRLLHDVRQVLEGGCRIVQYRNKCHDDDTKYAQAQQLRALTTSFNARLVINDDIMLAKTVSADGVHLGQSDQSIQQARCVLGHDALIGITCHNEIALAQLAVDAGADYVALGRFAHSHTKPADIYCSLTTLAKVKRTINIPIVAIGGINLSNAASIIGHGADMIALVHELFAASDIRARTQQLCQLFKNQ